MRRRERPGRRPGSLTVVEVKIPLRGLERLAERLNSFERDPLAPERLNPGPRARPGTARGAAGPNWPQLAGLVEWLFPAGAVDSRYVQIVPEEVRTGTPAAFSEAIRELFRRVLGSELISRVRRCETCGRWMVAKYRTRRRCSAACHARVWTYAHRQERTRKQRRPRR
jgi:hypothetical protein